MARIIDEKGRVFGLVNVIDLMVVLLILALLIAGLALVTGDTQEEPSPEPVTLDVRAEQVEPYIADAIPAEGPVDAEPIERVERKLVSPATVVVTDQNGELHLREHPRLQTVEVTVQVTPTQATDELRFDGKPLRIGSAVSLDFGNVEIEGTIIGFESAG